VIVQYGNFLFRYRNGLFPAVLGALFVIFRPVYFLGDERLDFRLDALGLLVALTGQAFRAIAIGYVYILRGGRDHKVYAEDLVTSGFFAHSRNPLYLGNVLILIGLFLIHGNPRVIGLGGLFFLSGYAAIVAAEEQYLAGKFGAAYEAYVRDVPRWLPRLQGLSHSMAGMRFNWKRLLSKEYGSMLMWSGGALLLLTQETLAYHSWHEREGRLRLLSAAFGFLFLGWGAARFLKKSGRLKNRRAEASG
jgi:protein-S-isoprenylcysteine O-methyltransferase Ste14